MAIRFYEMVGRIFSRSQTRQLGGLLESSGMDFVPEAFAGFLVVLCALTSLLTYFLFIGFAPLRAVLFKLGLMMAPGAVVSSPDFFTLFAAVISVLLASGVVCLAAYVSLLLMADERRRRVEDVLPEFLSLSAANVRAGMTIDQAMWYAAKPEFGILSDEVSIVAKKAFGGVPFNTAIDHLSERFSSKAMRRTVALIKQGIASGGKLADILERTAEDTRQMASLRKEISTSLLMYVIFIVFAGAIGTPFLFAISGKLVAIIEGVFISTNFSEISTSGYSSSLVMPQKPLITSSEFFIFTILCCIMTAIFSSLIIGVISKGSKKDGVAYLPILLVGSLLVFFIMGFLLDTLLSNIYI
ncbi:MAG: type II secretion system F family protein [Candidatus Micrarchaeia archaeon]|jgi:pilus assembly protein TadC